MIEKSGSAEVSRERIDAASEFAFLGLRLNCGIDFADYKKRFGQDFKQQYVDELERLKAAGLLEISGRRLRLTQKGMLFSNEVFAAFV